MVNTARQAKGVEVRCAEKLLPILSKPKRLKIALGGRSASKSICFADAFLYFCDVGEKLLCAREFQNSIEDSVHGLLKARIKELGVETLSSSATGITSQNGGEIFYKGLARNPDSIKSTYGIDKVWIEEGSTISQKTLDILLPTIREDNSEIWVSMNRGSSKDPIYSLVRPYEKEIARNGFYEDDDILIVEINYPDNPWFPEVMEKQRRRDKALLPRAKYNHIWLGHLSDSVDNAIIQPEWFDACVDSHKKLGFKAEGQDVVAHDPSDDGEDADARALAHRKGSVFIDVGENDKDDINKALDWSTDYANNNLADLYLWDCDGVGLGLKRDVSNAFKGKHTKFHMFKGGNTCYHPDKVIETLENEEKGLKKRVTNKDLFFNTIAQCYWELAERMRKTYRAVEHGEYIDPDELISFNSSIKKIDFLRSELCSVPKKENGNGKFQLVPKKDREDASPNMADCCAMTMAAKYINLENKKSTINLQMAQNFTHF